MILSLFFGFTFGVALGSLFFITYGLTFAVAFLSLIFYIYSRIVENPRRYFSIVISLVLVGMLFGMGRIYVSNLYTHSHLDTFVGTHIRAQGVIVEEPDTREHNTQLIVSLRNITIASSTIPVEEKILVSVPLYPEFHYGDLVSVSTILSVPKNVYSGGRIFDYVHYLRARDIWYVGTFPHVIYISSGHGNFLKNFLFSIKNVFTRALNRVIPEPESSLMAGLLIGTKQALGKELLSEFSRAGVSHVVVLSGYNIAIVAESIIAILSFSFAFLPSMVTFVIGAVSIFLFTVLSGGGASALRAAIMVLVALFAKNNNRQFHADRALGFAVVVMLLFNPLLLIFDPSFQLSILATVGLIFVSPILAPYFIRVTKKYGLREIISSTIATQVVVLPFLIYNTGIVSLVSLPVNILILGTIPLTMLLGFITGFVGIFSFYLSFIPALFAYIFLWYQLKVVHIGAALPFGVFILPAFSFWILTLIYIFIFFGLYVVKNNHSMKDVSSGY